MYLQARFSLELHLQRQPRTLWTFIKSKMFHMFESVTLRPPTSPLDASVVRKGAYSAAFATKGAEVYTLAVLSVQALQFVHPVLNCELAEQLIGTGTAARTLEVDVIGGEHGRDLEVLVASEGRGDNGAIRKCRG